MATFAQRTEQTQREDRTAIALGILLPSDELILWVRGLRRRGLIDEAELAFAMDMFAEIRRCGLRVKDGGGG